MKIGGRNKLLLMHFIRLPDDHVVDLNQNYDRNLEQWTLNDAIVSWDLVNFIINDLTYSAMRNWMTLNPSMHSELFDPILSHHFYSFIFTTDAYFFKKIES